MLEKLFLAATATIALNLFLGVTHSAPTMPTLANSKLPEASPQIMGLLMDQPLLPSWEALQNTQ